MIKKTSKFQKKIADFVNTEFPMCSQSKTCIEFIHNGFTQSFGTISRMNLVGATHPHRSSQTNDRFTTTLCSSAALCLDASSERDVVDEVVLQPSVKALEFATCAVLIDTPTNRITRAVTFCKTTLVWGYIFRYIKPSQFQWQHWAKWHGPRYMI